MLLALRIKDQSGQNPITVVVGVIAVLGLIPLGIRFVLVGALQLVWVNFLRHIPDAVLGAVALCGVGLVAWHEGDWGTGRGEGASAAANAVRFVWAPPGGYACGSSAKSLVGTGQSKKAAYIDLRNAAEKSRVSVVRVKRKVQENDKVVLHAIGCNVDP